MRETYRAALKVVDTKNPELSLLLRKPSSSSAAEGLVGVNAIAHGGGMRWSGPDDADYQTVLAWIKGAKEPSASIQRRGRTSSSASYNAVVTLAAACRVPTATLFDMRGVTAHESLGITLPPPEGMLPKSTRNGKRLWSRARTKRPVNST